MTNRHCPECRSPVFRYDGTEFCPTCQKEVLDEEDVEEAAGGGATAGVEGTDETPADEASANDAAGGRSAATDAAADGDVAEPTGRGDTAAPADTGGDATVSEGEAPRGPASDADSETEEGAETRPTPARDRRPARVDPPARREESTRRGAQGAEGGDLGEAEAALVRELTALTRRAEETRDVGRKRDLFGAAREAAETLQAIRRL